MYLLDERAHDISSNDIFGIPPQSKIVIHPETLREVGDPFVFL
jgi:hypothetical protein